MAEKKRSKKITYGFNLKKGDLKGKLKSSRIKQRDKRNPVRALARMIDDERQASDSGMYYEIHLDGQVYNVKKHGAFPKPGGPFYKPQKPSKVGPKRKKKFMGGVMKARGGTFKGVF